MGVLAKKKTKYAKKVHNRRRASEFETMRAKRRAERQKRYAAELRALRERHNRFTPAQRRRFADRARNESLTEEMVLISQQKTTPGHSQRKSSWTEKLNYRGQLKRSPSL